MVYGSFIRKNLIFNSHIEVYSSRYSLTCLNTTNVDPRGQCGLERAGIFNRRNPKSKSLQELYYVNEYSFLRPDRTCCATDF